MNLKGQHIGRLFTFLAGLIILAHTVVPHHHHFELRSSEQESTCECTSQEKNKENPVSHCHVFNILAVGKTTNSFLNNSSSENFSFILTGIIADIETFPVKNLITTLFDHQVKFLNHFFFTSQSLRAPPVNA